jgi:hypothetical protein
MLKYKVGDLVAVDIHSPTLPPFGTIGLVVDVSKGRAEFAEDRYYSIRFNDKETYFLYQHTLVKIC